MEVVSTKALKCILDHFGKEYSQEEKRYVCGTNKIALCAACTLRRATIYAGLHKFHGRLAKSALAICVTATFKPREPTSCIYNRYNPSKVSITMACPSILSLISVYCLLYFGSTLSLAATVPASGLTLSALDASGNLKNLSLSSPERKWYWVSGDGTQILPINGP